MPSFNWIGYSMCSINNPVGIIQILIYTFYKYLKQNVLTNWNKINKHILQILC